MTMSIVLRLVREALVFGRLAGEVEVVETGARTVVRDQDELVEFLRGSADEPEETSPNGEAGSR